MKCWIIIGFILEAGEIHVGELLPKMLYAN